MGKKVGKSQNNLQKDCTGALASVHLPCSGASKEVQVQSSLRSTAQAIRVAQR